MGCSVRSERATARLSHYGYNNQSWSKRSTLKNGTAVIKKLMQAVTAIAAILASAPASNADTLVGSPTDATGIDGLVVDGVTFTASPGTAATGSITVASGFCFPSGGNVIVDGTTFTTSATAGTGTDGYLLVDAECDSERPIFEKPE